MQPTFVITHLLASRHYGSPRYSMLKQCDDTARPAPKRQLLLLNGTGILTCFPFDVLELRYNLGPTNPRLIIIAEETWPLRRLGFSPNFAVTITRIFVSARSTGTQVPASARAKRLPTRLFFNTLWYRWSTLAPSIFGAINLDWWAVTHSLKDSCF